MLTGELSLERTRGDVGDAADGLDDRTTAGDDGADEDSELDLPVAVAGVVPAPAGALLEDGSLGVPVGVPVGVSAGVPVPTLPPSSTTATMETITTHAGSGSGATASGGGRRYRVKDDVTAGVVPGSHGAAVAMPAAAATSATSVRAMPSLGDIVLPPSGSAAVNPQSLYAALAALGPGPEPPASGRAPPLPSVSTLLQSSRS